MNALCRQVQPSSEAWCDGQSALSAVIWTVCNFVCFIAIKTTAAPVLTLHKELQALKDGYEEAICLVSIGINPHKLVCILHSPRQSPPMPGWKRVNQSEP